MRILYFLKENNGEDVKRCFERDTKYMKYEIVY